MEDDAMIIPEFQQNLQVFLQNYAKRAWDWYTLSVSIPCSENRLHRIAETVRLLPSKCAYAIKPSAQVLNTMLTETETIRFGMRLQLSYVFLKCTDVINAVVANTQCIMEGSKVGMYPSSVHPNNMLVFNQEYMDLLNMLNAPDLSLQKATQVFERVKHIPNPDIYHIYGIILFKCGLVKQAYEVLSTAIEWMQKQHGVLNSQSDLLNNSINMHEHMQWDLPEYLSTPSKYDSILEQAPQTPSCDQQGQGS